uniref:Triple gene block protein 2 n=1 Tax=Cactus virus X TaxID=112227 RepID=A0A1C8CI11_9VIRU|nr:triple gene block protein 2 [Cactus virus X]
MSGAPLRLTPPPDPAKVVLPLTIGLGLALIVFTLTRSTLPSVGDSSHSLPHGGWYKDGTKTVFYSGPRRISTNWSPVFLVFSLTLAIYVSYLLESRSRSRPCNHCGLKHT